MSSARRLLAALAVSLLSVSPLTFAAPPPEKIPGQPSYGTERYIEYVAGDLPLVLTSPHGGRLKPTALPDRTNGVTTMDANTQELARAVATAFFARTGHHVHLVASHLHRSKLDPNREIVEGAQGNPTAERAWHEFHASIREALAAAVARHGFAFLVDLHGHAHAIPRLELGYALDALPLNQSDAAFDNSGLIALTTLRDLAARLGGSPTALVRGPRSLGALFAARGLRAVPSPQEPQPGNNPFFSGGYIVRQHAAAPDTPKVDGLQIECHRLGLRDTAANHAHFAKIAAEVLTLFVEEHYPFKFPAPQK